MENILKKLSEPLKIQEVDFRIQSINKGGYATILAYKDARVDMRRLDEVCGVNWQDRYELIDGQLFCSIGIKVKEEWIWRQDVGTESYTEKQKGRASDAFKRAGFRWGIGRELYDYPRIKVKLLSNEFTAENGSIKQTYGLRVNEWSWIAEFEDNKVRRLIARDENGKLRYDSLAHERRKKPAPQPFLEKMDDNNNFTKEWAGLIKAIQNGQLKDTNQVKKFRLTDEIKSEIEQLLKDKKNGS